MHCVLSCCSRPAGRSPCSEPSKTAGLCGLKLSAHTPSQACTPCVCDDDLAALKLRRQLPSHLNAFVEHIYDHNI